MREYQQLLSNVLAYNLMEDDSYLMRSTRSGNVVSTFDHKIKFNLAHGFPATTTKKLAFNAVIGELLWFLSGKTDLQSLREYSNIPDGDWTIWTQDAERFGGKGNEELGAIYGSQWRNFGNGDSHGTDQITNLIRSLTNDPVSRYHIVSAWNPNVLNEIALPSCHMFFQCYVDIDQHGYKHLDMKWYQRSVDSFLGLPFNIASYAALLVFLAKLTGCRPRYLTGDLGDTHIYEQHLPQVKTVLGRIPFEAPAFKFPRFTSLEELLTYTAKDFHLVDYKHHGVLKGKLTVGAEDEGQSPEVSEGNKEG
jgi:thymidylate synthase